MIMQVKRLAVGLALSLLAMTVTSFSAIRIVAALTDYGSIAAYIGGDKIDVSSIAKANSNPHSVEVFPSFMAKVSRADVYLKSGLGLDQWSDAIIDGSRNNHIVVVDCSIGISVLEKPTHVDASMGDVHPFGNPHYWLDPANGIIIARNVTDALVKVDGQNTAFYEGNFNRFKAECLNRLTGWKERMKALDGGNIITYHSSWPYFAKAFNCSIVEHVEPFPGIPPTGNHLARLVEVIKKEHVALILQEPYFPDDAPKFLNRQTGVSVFKCAPSCKDVKPGSYFAHFDDIISHLSTAQGGK